MSVLNTANKRIASLDQFRGYTVAGMFLVNFLSPFVAAPFVLKHHSSYCSYADTIMGNFLFAVGFAFRLSFGRRAIQQGLAQAYWHVFKRLSDSHWLPLSSTRGARNFQRGPSSTGRQ